MGAVVMSVRSDFMHRGYSLYTANLYIYCDHCGSFNIKKYLNFRKWLAIILIGCVLTGTVTYIYWKYIIPSKPIYCAPVIFGALVLFLLIKFLWGDASYKCRKCGKATTVRSNTLDYPPRDTSILDVPESLTQKRSFDFWPDEIDIDEWLKKPG